MEVQLIAVFDIILWQGVPTTEVGQLFKRRFVLTVCVVYSDTTVFIFADSGVLVKIQRNSEFCGVQYLHRNKEYIRMLRERDSGIQIKLPQ